MILSLSASYGPAFSSSLQGEHKNNIIYPLSVKHHNHVDITVHLEFSVARLRLRGLVYFKFHIFVRNMHASLGM